jgi:putative beta-1,4-xylosyltransferase IRX10
MYRVAWHWKEQLFIICVKFQVKIHRLLLKSKYRTMKKDEADFFFVPSYVKCVRMMGGLNDKEINQTYVKV